MHGDVLKERFSGRAHVPIKRAMAVSSRHMENAIYNVHTHSLEAEYAVGQMACFKNESFVV